MALACLGTFTFSQASAKPLFAANLLAAMQHIAATEDACSKASRLDLALPEKLFSRLSLAVNLSL